MCIRDRSQAAEDKHHNVQSATDRVRKDKGQVLGAVLAMRKYSTYVLFISTSLSTDERTSSILISLETNRMWFTVPSNLITSFSLPTVSQQVVVVFDVVDLIHILYKNIHSNVLVTMQPGQKYIGHISFSFFNSINGITHSI